MAATFDSPKEFKAVIDRVFSMMDEDPDMGPKLRDADVPMRYEFEDVDLVANIRATRDDEDGNLHWEWSGDVVRDREQVLPGQGERRDGDRPPAHQVRRRREGRAGADAGHEAGVRAVP